VSDYLDGALDDEMARTVEGHLAGCPTCPPLYASLVGVQEQLAELRDPDSVIPDDLKARLDTSGGPTP
jgi:RNA polymerase sigma-70 factor (ECF subfamily)